VAATQTQNLDVKIKRTRTHNVSRKLEKAKIQSKKVKISLLGELQHKMLDMK